MDEHSDGSHTASDGSSEDRTNGNDRSDDHDHHHDENRDHHDHDHHDHDHHHHDIHELRFAILTISSSRGIDEDAAGNTIAELLEADGHTISVRELINDDFDAIQNTIDRLANRGDTDCVITTGGTGVTPDDVTVEAAEPLFDKRLPGFGELFRTLSRAEVGTRVVGTRATAGIVEEAPVFCLPGSENAVRLGTEEIIREEAPHLAGLARRDTDETEE